MTTRSRTTPTGRSSSTTGRWWKPPRSLSIPAPVCRPVKLLVALRHAFRDATDRRRLRATVGDGFWGRVPGFWGRGAGILRASQGPQGG
jgi:hypothetical protein